MRLAADILSGVDARIGRLIPGFRPRPGQVAFAQAVAEALEANDRVLLADAPTGIGKSLGYLMPACLAVRPGYGQPWMHRVVIATATKALQDQLDHVEMPRVARLLGGEIEWRAVYGKTNYFCQTVADESLRLGEVSKGDYGRAVRAYEQTAWCGRWDGEHAPPMSDEARKALSGDHDCSCAAGSCPVSRARSDLDTCNVLLVNFASLALDLKIRASSDGTKGLLPSYSAVVLDEAHLLPEYTRDLLTERVSWHSVARAVAPLMRWGPKHLEPVVAMGLAAEIESAAEELWDGDDWESAARDLMHALRDAAEVWRRVGSKWSVTLRWVAQAERLADRLSMWVMGFQAEGTVLMRKGRALEERLVDVGPWLERRLFGQGMPVVATSATLAPLGEARRALGAPVSSEEVLIPEPESVKDRMLLVCPEGAGDPRREEERAGRDAALVAAVAESGGGALILCTSWVRAREAAGVLERRWDGTVLLQGSVARDLLIERFKTERDSVLVGVGAMWQGLDVPGDSLRLVVIDRLPFAPSDKPGARTNDGEVLVDKASTEDDDRNWFWDIELPRAVRRFRQGVGRLLRTETDRGCVVVLDARLVRMRYGDTFVNALPACARTRKAGAVRKFLGR